MDFKWLHKDLKGRSDKSSESLEIWEQIYDSYIKYVGMEKEYMELVQCKVKLHKLMCERIETGNRFISNYIAIEEAKIQSLENMFDDKKGISNLETIEVLEDDRPIPIDIWKTTVIKFYAQVKHLTEKRKKEVSLSKVA